MHHRLVTGRVTMRMKLAQYVTDGTCRFLVFRGSQQTEFRHRIDDAALHRFQAITDMRQRAVENDVHGIIQVGLLGKGLQRQLSMPS